MTYEEKVKTARYIAEVFKNFNSGLPIPEKDANLDWSFIYGMAKKHSVSALVFRALEERIKKEAPEALYLDFSRDAAIVSARHVAQKEAFKTLTARFSENKIPFLPLKGFIIKELYSSPELREMTDIDVFVGEEDFVRAKEVILSLGYIPEAQLEVHDSFKKPPFVEIELHRILHNDLKSYSMKDAKALASEPYWYEMNEEDLFVFLLHHAKKHDETGGMGIRTVFDFYLLFEKYKDSGVMKTLSERLEKEGLLDFYRRLSSLIGFWFYSESLTQEIFELEVYTVTGGTYGTLENMFIRDKKKNRGSLVLRRLFPPYKLMSSKYPVLKKCPVLLPLFYPVRMIVSLFNGAILRNIKALFGAGKKKKELDKLSFDNKDKI